VGECAPRGRCRGASRACRPGWGAGLGPHTQSSAAHADRPASACVRHNHFCRITAATGGEQHLLHNLPVPEKGEAWVRPWEWAVSPCRQQREELVQRLPIRGWQDCLRTSANTKQQLPSLEPKAGRTPGDLQPEEGHPECQAYGKGDNSPKARRRKRLDLTLRKRSDMDRTSPLAAPGQALVPAPHGPGANARSAGARGGCLAACLALGGAAGAAAAAGGRGPQAALGLVPWPFPPQSPGAPGGLPLPPPPGTRAPGARVRLPCSGSQTRAEASNRRRAASHLETIWCGVRSSAAWCPRSWRAQGPRRCPAALPLRLALPRLLAARMRPLPPQRAETAQGLLPPPPPADHIWNALQEGALGQGSRHRFRTLAATPSTPVIERCGHRHRSRKSQSASERSKEQETHPELHRTGSGVAVSACGGPRALHPYQCVVRPSCTVGPVPFCSRVAASLHLSWRSRGARAGLRQAPP